MDGEAQYRFIVNLDTQGSGGIPDEDRPAMRSQLYELTGEAFEQARIGSALLHQEDRGDGILSVLESAVPPLRVVGEWIEYLHQNLRAGNRRMKDPLRLRAGLHIGPVISDAHGWSGRAVDLACRLGNCGTAKAVLNAAPGSWLVVVASDTLYREVVQRGGRWVEPGHYRRHTVTLQEGEETAWIQVPGLDAPPAPDDAAALAPEGAESLRPAPAEEPGVPRKSGAVVTHHGSGSVFNDIDSIGTVNIGRSAGDDQ
jgi:hypothetical protein